MEDSKLKAQKTYNAAADTFDDPANAFWGRYGQKTVDLLQLKAGDRILDLGCGTGASAIPAAKKVGSAGHVTAIDLAENMLEKAKQKAKKDSLNNITFMNADMTRLDFPLNHFDTVICIFGVFFVDDMENFVQHLWKFLKPGGKLALTTWGPRLFEPVYEQFDKALLKIRPDLVSHFRPWDRLIEKQLLEDLLATTGSTNIMTLEETGTQNLSSPDDWWKCVLGSGIRSVVESMTTEEANLIYQDNARFIQKNSITSIETNVVYGVAVK